MMWGYLGTFRDVSGCFGVFRVAAIVRLGMFRGLSGLRRNLLRRFLCDSAVSVRKPAENTSVLLEETRKWCRSVMSSHPAIFKVVPAAVRFDGG